MATKHTYALLLLFIFNSYKQAALLAYFYYRIYSQSDVVC